MQIPLDKKKFIKNISGSIFLFLLGIGTLFILSFLLHVNTALAGNRLIYLYLGSSLLILFGVFFIFHHVKIWKNREAVISLTENRVIDYTGFIRMKNIDLEKVEAVEYYKTDKGIKYYNIVLSLSGKRRNVIISDRLISDQDLDNLIDRINDLI